MKKDAENIVAVDCKFCDKSKYPEIWKNKTLYPEGNLKTLMLHLDTGTYNCFFCKSKGLIKEL